MKYFLVKDGRKIKGFVYQKKDNTWWYAFGKPSQNNWFEFGCKDLQHGIDMITFPTRI